MHQYDIEECVRVAREALEEPANAHYIAVNGEREALFIALAAALAKLEDIREERAYLDRCGKDI